MATEEYTAGVILANKLNRAFGGPFFLPWEVSEVAGAYEPYVEAALGIIDKLPEMKAARDKIESKMAEIRRKHFESIKH